MAAAGTVSADLEDFDRLWRRRFAEAAAAMPSLAKAARPVLLGFSAFVDASVRLEKAARLFAANAPLPARDLGRELLARIRSGRGGEYRIDWPAGDEWLAANLPHEIGAGGTSAQIAKAFGILGAPALLALADRSPAQLAVLDPSILIAEGGAAWPLAAIAPDPARAKARHWIFESTAGTEVAGEIVSRSTRVIVRLVDDVPEDDPAFAELSLAMAPDAGAAAISSLVSTPDDLLPATLARVADLARGWRAAGLGFVHIELADYGHRPHLPAMILGSLAGIVTSVGMSLSEWRVIGEGPAEPGPMAAFARRHNLDRLCVHADDHALAVTRGDADREARALFAGCVLAGARAAAGRPVRPQDVPTEAVFSPPSEFRGSADGYAAVACPAPWLSRPASTIGLGDTFLAGTLLVHCQPPGG
jgi:ADP-dependent phosphofructokinase/glucokinase